MMIQIDLRLPQRRRHAAVDPVVAQVQEQQLLGHLHAGQVEPELVPGQVDGPVHRLAPPEEERRVPGELVVGHRELHPVPLQHVHPGYGESSSVCLKIFFQLLYNM